MNFISMMRQEELAVELKYCERCGGLWLRRSEQDGVHCERCQAQRAALLSRGRGRMEQNSLQIECLRGVAETEVRP
jgi:Zn-finger nucleic acid-binding protein